MQLVLDLVGCTEKLDSVPPVRSFLLRLNKDILRMRILCDPIMRYIYNADEPALNGVSGIMMIETSHVAVHTFSVLKEIHLDVYSCKDFMAGKVIEMTIKVFGGRIDNQYILLR